MCPLVANLHARRLGESGGVVVRCNGPGMARRNDEGRDLCNGAGRLRMGVCSAIFQQAGVGPANAQRKQPRQQYRQDGIASGVKSGKKCHKMLLETTPMVRRLRGQGLICIKGNRGSGTAAGIHGVALLRIGRRGAGGSPTGEAGNRVEPPACARLQRACKIVCYVINSKLSII